MLADRRSQTHPHADHIGNMAWVLDTFAVGLYVDNGNTYDSATYRRVEAAFARRQPAYWSAQDDLVPDVDFCPRMNLGALVIRYDGYGSDSDPNENSVIIRVDYGEESFLFMGDAEHRAEEHLLADPLARTCTWSATIASATIRAWGTS